MTLSLRNALVQIGEPGADGKLPGWPKGLHCAPKSLRDLVRMTASPQMAGWTRPNEWEFSNKDWTEECQGVTSDGEYWYFSSNKSGILLESERRSIYKFTINMSMVAEFHVGETYGSHIGDLDYYNGNLYVPVEGPLGLLIVSKDFVWSQYKQIKGKDGGAPPQTHFSWCAINPINGYLYSSDFDGVDRVYAYDPDRDFRHVATLQLGVATNGVQGGCFSPEGKLYLSSSSSHDIRGFSALNGQYLGSAGIQVSAGDEEVEGICIWKMITNGAATQVHVILLDNDDTSGDDIWFKHYASPAPDNV